MKKISLFLVLILVLCSAGCGSSESVSKLISTPANIDGFQHADFDKFNSPASENGLGGTKIYIDGILEDVDIIKDTNILYGALNDNIGKWNVNLSLEGKEFIKKAELLEGVSVRLFGVYAGFSSKFERPIVDLIKMTKLDTAESIHALEYMSLYSAAYDGFIDGMINSAKELNISGNNNKNSTVSNDISVDEYIRNLEVKSGKILNHLTTTVVKDITAHIYTIDLHDTKISVHISENNNTGIISTVDIYFKNAFKQDFYCSAIQALDSTIVTDNEALDILERLHESINEDVSIGVYKHNGYTYMLNPTTDYVVSINILKD